MNGETIRVDGGVRLPPNGVRMTENSLQYSQKRGQSSLNYTQPS